MALFSPINPPQNYSFADRNFAQEYKESKDAYLKQQQQQQQFSASEISQAKFDFPLACSMR
jgi:hypothetical protein